MPEFFKRCENLQPFIDAISHEEPGLLCLFGDSNTCNTDFTKGAKQWGELLHSELRNQYSTQSVLLINAAISGMDTIGGLQRWHSDIARFQPDCAIYSHGSNDANRVSADEFRDAMNRSLDKFAAMGTRVLVRTPVPVLEYEPKPGHIWHENVKADKIREIILEIADQRQLACVDVYAQFLAAEKEDNFDFESLMHDAVHTNALGHQMVYRCVAPAFGLKPHLSWESES